MTRRTGLFVLAVTLCIVCWVFTAPYLASRLIVEQTLERADLIFVLSGSAAYKQRAALGAELFAKGAADRIALSNDGGRAGWSNEERTNLAYIELARRELVSRGVAPDAIIQLPGEVTSTYSEATTLAEAADELQIRSVIIVTSPYHTRRALYTFRKAMPNLEFGIAATPVGYESPNPNWWWLSAAGWRDVGAEYMKSPVYWLFY